MTQSIPQLPDQTNANLLAAAKVVLQEFGTSSDGLQELYQAVNAAIIANASAALAAQPLVGVIPEGMALVPIEPTEEMCQAALDCQDHDPEDQPITEMYHLYHAMLAAAPQPLAVQQDRGDAAAQGAAREPLTCDTLKSHFTPFYLLANCRRICSKEYQLSPNWVIAGELFAVGSTSARKICREADIDPEAFELKRNTAPAIGTPTQGVDHG